MAVDRTTREYFAAHYQKYGKEWYVQNKERQQETQKRYREKYLDRCLWRNARLRAKKNGIEFTITYSDIVIQSVCPVFGVDYSTGGMAAASLDRIDNSVGYVPGNIQVISRRANTMKGDATIEEMKIFAKWAVTL